MQAVALIATDPALDLAARLLLVVLFASGLRHKLSAPRGFALNVANYRLLPAVLSWPVAIVLIGAEMAATLGLIAQAHWGGLLALALLGLYTAAIAGNLLRGRVDIDCGCSGPALRQTLNGWLVLRNGLLLALAAVVVWPSGDRSLALLDWFSVLALSATATLLYVSANQLAVTHRRLSS